jgi:hypothetical protein
VGYLLFSAKTPTLDWPAVLGKRVELDSSGRAAAEREVKKFAIRERLSTDEKDALLRDLAGLVEVDYAAFKRGRHLQIITKAEACEMAAHGIDLQLHTHRHRLPAIAEMFHNEIRDNRMWLSETTGGAVEHLAYPNGHYLEIPKEWLIEEGIVSATTDNPGLASLESDCLRLPRVTDNAVMSDATFDAWITGTAEMMPRRNQEARFPAEEDQLSAEPADSYGRKTLAAGRDPVA